MPEADTVFRLARTLARALAGQTVTSFVSVYPALTRINEDTPVVGRTITGVRAAGKHLLIEFSSDRRSCSSPGWTHSARFRRWRVPRCTLSLPQHGACWR
jgi:formamidopyrimidine-DNA glycosylase